MDRLVEVATQLIEDVDCLFQVTSIMLKAALKLKCREKTILRALHDRGVWFRSFREKPLLTEDDAKDRLQFTKAHAKKPFTFWTRTISAYLDDT